MDAIPAASELPVCPLFRGGVKQPRVPSQWCRDGAAISEVDTDRVLGERYADHLLTSLKIRSTHATPFGLHSSGASASQAGWEQSTNVEFDLIERGDTDHCISPPCTES